jgi:histidine triad (HIT) family protein
MSTLFAKIISGEISCYKIHENEEFFAFLDINPLKEGHTLIVPKIQVDYFYDLDDDVLSRLMVFAKSVAVALKNAIPCVRIGTTIIGLEVPHAHIHLIPINNSKDMIISKPKLNLSSDEMLEIQKRILSQIEE